MAHGFTVQGGLGAGASIIPHESSAHSVLVPDTELLFTAQFHRAGPDLVLIGRDGQHHLIPGYFASEHHPALVAPNGAHLSPDTVDLLAGSATPGHYAQAQPTTPPDAIGKIEKVVGDVSVVRNGATVALHVGDAVFKSDVVQTGASSSCGISFPDGTALNLVANTRMALNDYAYDANSNGNGALFTLVEGTFAFVAGKVAHSGDMKIATPVATMGIRGTTGVVQEQPDTAATITAQAGGHTYSFAVVPDIGTGITGMWDVYLTDANGIIQRDANGNPIVLATVSQSGYVTYLTPQGLGQPPLVSTEPATNSQYAFEQDMLQQLFRTLNPANLNGNGNNGSSTPPPPFEQPNPIPQLFEDSGKPFTINVPNGSSTPTPTIIDIVTGPTGPLTVVIWIAGGSGPWSSGPSWLGGAPPTSPQEVEILNPVKVTTDGADSAAGLIINAGATLNIVSGTSFTIYDFIHGGGTIALNSSGSDPTLFVHGGVTLVGGGTIKMLGPTGEDNILGVSGTGAALVNVDYTIEGTGTIGGGDGNLTFENFGIVNASGGCLIVDTGNQVYNDGLMEATADPLAATTGTLAIKDSVVNAGTVQADGAGTAVTLSGATFDNLFWVIAKNGGSVTFTNVAVTNEAVSATDLAGGTINANGGTIVFDGGSIANGNLLEATNGGTLQLENITVTNSSAGTASVDATSTLDLMGAAIRGGTIENDGNVVVTDGASVLHGDTVTNSGTMTVEAGASLTLEGDTTLFNDGIITADGDGAKITIEIDADANVNSKTIEAVNGGEVDFYINIDGGSNYGLIEAGAGGTVHFFQTNNSGGGGGGGSGDHGGNYGTMEAADGGVFIFDGGLDNFYLVEAVDGGTVDVKNGINNHGGTVEAIGSDSVTAVTTAITVNGDVINDAKIEATGFGAQINISNSDSSENAGTIIAENHGTITLSSVQLENDQDAKVEANGATINYTGGTITNDGTFKSDHQGAIFIGSNTIVHNDGTGVFEALSNGFITFSNSTVYNGVSVSGASGGTIDASCDGSITFADGTVYNGSSVPGSPGGIIQASCGGTVTFSLSCTIYNNNDVGGPGGVIEALRGGTVDIDTSTVFNDNGTIEAIGCGAVVNLFGTDIYGGTLASSDGGVIEATFARSTLQDVTILGGSVLDAADTGLGGSFALSDTTTLAGGGTVTFEGAGEFLLGGDIVASTTGTTLKNFSTIDGSGEIGAADGKLTLDNESAGTIDANEPGFVLTIHTGNTVTNAGTLEATNGGTLQIDDSVANESCGVILATGTGSTVSITFNGGGVNNCGMEEAAAGGTLNLTDDSGGVGNNSGGTIKADAGTVSITGGVDNNGKIEAVDGGTLTITIDNLNNNEGGVGNFGTIKADGGTVTIVATVSDAIVLNSGNGTIEAIDCGVVSLEDVTVDNSGMIKADGHHAVINLDVVTINGGTLATTDGGIIETVADSGISTLSGVTIDDGSILKADTGSSLDLECTTALDGTVTFEGCGTFVLDPGVASIVGGSGGGTLDIAAGATLTGSGEIGNAGATALALNNSGTVDANICEATLTVDTGNTVSNAGLLEATNGGTLEIDDKVCNTACGVISASGHDSVVQLDGVMIIGGTLETSKGGVIDATGTSTLSNVTIADGSTLEAGTGATFLLEGTTTVSDPVIFKGCGTFELSGKGAAIVGSGDDADLHNYATISGAGTIGSVDLSLTNECGGVIDATGCLSINLSSNDLTNDGTMEATCGGELTLLSPVINYGVIAAYAGSTVYIGNEVSNEAIGQVSGEVIASGHCAVVDLSNATIIGGTVASDKGGLIQTVTGADDTPTTSALEGVTVRCGSDIKVADQTTLILEAGTTMSGGRLSIESSGDVEIANGGGTGGATLTDVNLQNCGEISIDGDTTLTLSGTTVHGGTIDGTDVSGCVVASTIDITGDSRFCDVGLSHGDLTVEGGFTLTLNGGTICDVAIEDGTVTSCGVIAGTIDVTGDATFTNTNLNDGNLTVESGVKLSVEGDATTTTFDGVHVTDNGTIQVDEPLPTTTLLLENDTTISGDGTLSIGGTGILDVEGGATLDGLTVDVCSGGIIEVGETTSGSILTLDDGTTVTGGGAGQLTINFANTLDVEKGTNDCHNGATLDGVIVQDNGTIDIGHTATGAILTLDDGATINGGGSAALTIHAGSTLDVENGAHGGGATLDDVHVTDCGAFDIGDVASGAILTLQDDATITGGGIGTMTIHANNTVDVESIGLNGGATLDGVQVTDNGALDIGDVATGAILTLDDGTSVSGCGAMTINAGGTLDIDSGTTTINLGGTITNHGTLEASCGGTLDIVSHVDNACGALLATSGGVLDVQSCISGGTATIHGATLEFDAASNVNVTFDNGSVDSPTYGTLVLGDPADFCGTIANFTGTCPDASHSDTIDLADFKACNTTLNATYNGDDGITTLCVVDTTDDLSATLKLIGQYSTGNFTIAGDGKGGIDIFDPPTTGATDAPATATAAPGNDHVAASAHQNGLDPAASPANAAGFGGDQDSAAAATAPDGAATPPASQLALAGDTVAAPPSATSALGGNDLAGFGDDPATVPTPGGVNGGAVTMQLTAVASPIAVVASGTPVLDGEHLTDSTFVDGSDIAQSEVTPSTVPTAPTNNEHTVAPALATSPAPAASPTLASASFGSLGNDSFAFHPNLGNDTAQNTDAHASDLAHNNLQIAGSAPAAIAPEFHAEFAFDAIHQDVAAVAATVDQFHQMAANTTLLH
jgi:fibronectin-binding autotransporter adhesin